MIRASWLVLIIFFTTCSTYAAVPKIDKPDWLEITEVSSEMNVMGFPAAVYMFSGPYKIDDIFKYYKKKWRTIKKDSVKEEYVEPWHILTSLKKNYLYTIQAKQEGGLIVRGYLAVSDVEEKSVKVKESVPSLSGSKTVNDYAMKDPGKKGRVVLLSNHHTIDANHNYYKNYYVSNGWQVEVSRQTAESSLQVFRNRTKQSHVVISKLYGQTQVVLNLVEN